MPAAPHGAVRNGNVIMMALIASFPAPRIVVTSLAATLAISAAITFTGKSSSQQAIHLRLHIINASRSELNVAGSGFHHTPVCFYLP